jgi:flagellar hook assembly protein FlgD
MLLRVVVIAGVLAALAPSPALAAEVRFTTREEPLAGSRALAAGSRVLPPRLAPGAFNLLGIHWRGPGEVSFRTSGDGRTWSAWHQAMPEGEDGPDPGTREGGREPAWRLGNPWWTGPSRFVQYRVDATVTRVRAHFVWSEPTRVRTPSASATPEIIPRSGWDADESIVRARPSFTPGLERAIVHHTAGRNDYGPEDSAAIIRAIQEYHVKANRWNDIGYNFLVDRFGRVFEGRAGGVDRNVVGAHARGWNAGSVGVAVLGSHGGVPVSQDAAAALADLLAWRLDLAHVDPLGVSPAGLHAVSGHRDVSDTACPGDAFSMQLPAIAQTAAARGLPKLYEPAALPAKLVALPDGTSVPILFSARLSSPQPWTVTVAEAETGTPVASGSGFGQAISWTWDGRDHGGTAVDAAAEYVVTFSSQADVRPASLVLTGSGAAPAKLEVAGLAVSPQTATPNGDGAGETVRISFDLEVAASVRVRLADETGTVVTTILPERPAEAGTVEVVWDGRGQEGEPVADGRYSVVALARRDGVTVSASVPLVLDRTLAALDVSPRFLSPNGDGRHDEVVVSFDLARAAEALVTVRAGGTVVATLVAGTLAAGEQRIAWAGAGDAGSVPDGRYLVVAEATTGFGTRRLARMVSVDTRPPRLRVLGVTVRGRSTRVRFAVDERASVRIWSAGVSRVVDVRAGSRSVVLTGAASGVRLRAWDVAGNASRIAKARAGLR